MNYFKKHVDYLGYKAKDKVTGFKGVISSVSFDLYGCVQCVITPEKLNKDGNIQNGCWFDISRLDIISGKRVINNPFLVDDNQNKESIIQGKKGAAGKPQKY